MPCQGAHGTMGCCPCHGPTCCKAREGLAHVSQAPPCLPQSSCCSNTPCCVLVSLICNNELWHWTHGLSFPCTGHCTLVQRISHASKLALWLQHHHALSKTFLSAATSLCPWPIEPPWCTRYCTLVLALGKGEVALHSVLLQPHVACHTCHGAHVWVLAFFSVCYVHA